ncbi:MAG: SDR family oxidoreductase [Sphingobacteriia bacterium]|nr:SDR family oxidoreductase [Sphingobacteriia bacterium]NCC39340.1 SDR family oxidoreductase [Gammaproteobacteria bacterium]
MRGQQVLILGGASAIAEQVARLLASRGAALYLTGRDQARLEKIAADLRVRGASRVVIEPLELTDIAAVGGVVGRAQESLDGLDTLLIAAGVLPEQERASAEPALLREGLEINASVPMLVLEEAARLFEQKGRGQLVAIGSVAGDRGRATNYAYGAAKGALEIFLSGLRQRLSRRGVKVLLVKPGFVDTPMTVEFKKGPLWASPERVAQDIVRAMERGRAVIYTPWWWRWIMLIIRHIPEPIFVRLRF